MSRWEKRQLGEICKCASSNVAQNKIMDDHGDYPIFGASGFIKNVSFYHQDKPYLSIVKDGSGVGRVTKMDVFTSVIGTLQYIIPNEDVSIDYLNYCLKLVDFKKYVAGAAIPHIYFKDYKKETVFWMPLEEQLRIVSVLDECFAAIDKAKANAEKNLKNAKELFDSYLQGVFENEDWEFKKLNEIAINLDNKRIPITQNKRTKGKIPYYGASGIVDYVESHIFNEDLLLVSEDGANLVMRNYPIAFSVSGKIWVNNHAHVLKFDRIETQLFVEYYLNSIKLDKYISGMAQPKLNQRQLNEIPIPFPSLKEQQTIVNQLNVLRLETQKLQEVYQQKLTYLEELKKSILQKAFAGELETVKEVVV